MTYNLPDHTNHASHPTPALTTLLLERICVRPPYFALQNLQQLGDTLTATAPTEIAFGLEQAPIGSPEVGRHAAILGSCVAALAQRDDARRYYLAQRAIMTSYAVPTAAQDVHYTARLAYLDKRKAVAQVGVQADGVPFSDLTIDYTVLTASAFARLFRTRQQPGVATSGYQAELSGRWQRQQDFISFIVPKIPLSVCAGHFESHPALPVAVLMSYLVRLGGYLIDGPYRSVHGEVAADDLCWAGADVRFEVARTHCEGQRQFFRGTALSEGRAKGEMTFSLDAF